MKKYPFKLLDAYSQNDTDIFFGRTEEIKALYEMVFQHSILLVYGASGTGKTSLIQCGLAGKFKSYDWLALNIRRSGNINTSLEKALEAAIENDENDGEETDTDKEVLTGFQKLIRQVYITHFKPIYLIFDQFEELYILGDRNEEKQFVESVKTILSSGQPVKLIFSIREEYLGHLYEFERSVPQLMRKKLRVEPMSIDNVSNVFTGINDFKNSNVRFKTDEIPGIVEDTLKRLKGDSKTFTVQLPYLQLFLDKLYLKITKDTSRQTKALITHADVLAMGEIGDVLGEFLEEQVKSISQENKAAGNNLDSSAIWKFLSIFCTLGGTKDPLNKNEIHERLPGFNQKQVDDCLAAFTSRRILSYAEKIDRYELAHDTLAKYIAGKRTPADIKLLEARSLISQQLSIKSDARELFTNKQLKIIKPHIPKLILKKEEQALLDASFRASEKRRQNTIVMTTATVALLVCSVIFVRQYNVRKIQKSIDANNLSTFKQKREQAIGKGWILQCYLFTIDYLSMESDAGKRNKVIREMIKRSYQPAYAIENMLAHISTVNRACFAPGDTSIYTWMDSEGLISEWSIASGKLIRQTKYTIEPTEKDENILVTQEAGRVFVSRNTQSLQLSDTVFRDSSIFYKKLYIDSVIGEKDIVGLPLLPSTTLSIEGANRSHDRQLIATWGRNTESIYSGINILDAEGLPEGTLLIHDGILGAGFNNDHTRLLTWGSDSTVRIWKNENDTGIYQLPPKLMKLKANIQEGVEISDADRTLKVIGVRRYTALKEEFLELYAQYLRNKKKEN